ncbi:MAG: transglycosylase domain-containing protein [Actinomycetota bacterium]
MTFEQRVRTIRHRPLDIVLASTVVLILVPLILGGAAASIVYLYFFKLSPPVAIPEPKGVTISRSSHIYAADGSLLATLRGANYRVPIDYEQMPLHFRQAAIASEDSRFFEHEGLDLQAIIKALTEDRRPGQRLRGASTITQQYVGTVFTGKERTLARKIREAQFARELEKDVSKEKILERYLNTVYFGAGAYGVEAAANTYFAKPAGKLTISESALLVGLIPAPARFSPYLQPDQAERRRVEVVRLMQENGFLSASSAAATRADRPQLQEARPVEEILKYHWFVDAVKKYIQDRYGTDRLYNGGLEIYTTIDPRMQDLAESAVFSALPSPGDPYASLVSVEPSTGYVRALVGGRGYDDERFNLAIQARRQPGSSFKPFVLVSALESGMLPTTPFDGPATICLAQWRPDCEVSNFDSTGFGNITLEKATVNSVNTVYAQVILKLGPKEVVEVTERMGIPGPAWLPPRSGCVKTQADACRTEIEPVPALTLGSEEATPLEMASAFGTLANRGEYREPKVVTKVTDSAGTVLEEGPSKPEQALDQQIADNATRILQGVITGGTGTRADIGRPAAGKTGTAQDFQNAWFVGYTPELSTSVWLGYREANRPLLRVRGLERVTGGTIPAQIWAAFMKPALDGAPVAEFAEAEELQSFELPFRPPDPLADPFLLPETPAQIVDLPQAPPSPAATPGPQGGLLDLLGIRPEGPPSPAPAPSPTPSDLAPATPDPLLSGTPPP